MRELLRQGCGNICIGAPQWGKVLRRSWLIPPMPFALRDKNSRRSCAGTCCSSPLRRDYCVFTPQALWCWPRHEGGCRRCWWSRPFFAVLFAKALGADEVVGISRKASKRQEALELGCDEYIATDDDDGWVTHNTRRFHLIICTVSSDKVRLPFHRFPYLWKSKRRGEEKEQETCQCANNIVRCRCKITSTPCVSMALWCRLEFLKSQCRWEA